MKTAFCVVAAVLAGLMVVSSSQGEPAAARSDGAGRAVRRPPESPHRSNAAVQAGAGIAPAIRNPTDASGGRQLSPVEQLFQYLQQKNPAEFERMKKLRKENPEAFRNELKKKLEATRIRLEQQKRKTETVAGAPAADGSQRRPMVRLMEHLKAKRPEVYERLEKLRRENPKAFQEELLKLAQKARVERGAAEPAAAPIRRQEMIPSEADREPSRSNSSPEALLRQRVHEEAARLARAYRSADSESDRRAIREKAEILADRYVNEQARRDRELAERLEQQMLDMRRRLENRQRERGEMRRHLVERILGERAA